MVFTAEQDAFIVMAHFRSGTKNADGTWSYSLQSCLEQFLEEYPDVIVDYDVFKNHKYVLVKRYREKYCICKGKSTGRPTVLTENVVAGINTLIERSPTKSVRRLSAQTGLSSSSCRKALTKSLHMHPYKVSVVQHLQVPDYNKRIQYCQWFNQNINDNILDVSFYSDEAWVHLSGFVNNQNYRTWATENPYNFVETQLHPQKIGIWLAVSRRRVLGPIFFRETVTAQRYRGILQEAIAQMHDDEIQTGYFQQDGATAHTANATIAFLEEFYGDRLISRGLWPPRSPDLTPLDFYLFGRIKNNVFKHRLQNLEELEVAIQHEVQNITQEELENVFNSMKRRVNLCLANGGGHFEHL